MKHKMSKADRTGLWCSRVFIWFFIALMIFPVLWIVAASFSKGDSFFRTSLLPSEVGTPTYYEAAKIDGASRWDCFRKITFPMLTRLSTPLIISTFASNFNNFGNIYMITQGGPAVPGSQFAGGTDILASTIYKMTTWSNRFDLSATLSVFVFLIVGGLTLFSMNLSGSFKEEN